MSLPLSPRETEALRHYAAGRCGKQVASAMGVSLNTVKTFTKALRHKLGARTVAHAVALDLKSETTQ
jgi:DNA-binding CsgD family transcriptional regulator